MTDRPVPFPDRDSLPWWEAIARHEFIQQRCTDCGAFRWPPRAMCSECESFTSSWEPVAATGTIVSFICTHHSFLASMPAPYYTVFVSLDAQADIVMPGSWHAELAPLMEMRVKVVYDDIRQGDTTVALVGWQPL